MQDSQFDDAHRAAEAFMAANRCEDPEQAARLRQEAYKLVERIREERERHWKPERRAEDRQLAWGDVLPSLRPD